MKRCWTALVLACVFALLGERVYTMQARLAAFERAPRADPATVSMLRAELGRVRAQLSDSQAALDDICAREASRDVLETRVGQVEALLDTTSEDIRRQEAQLQLWRSKSDEIGSDAVERRIREMKTRLQAHWEEISGLAASTKEVVDRNERALERLEHDLEPDTEQMWAELVGPTVQLAGESTVGSGVLLESQRDPHASTYTTYLITSWHVIRDIRSDYDDPDHPIPVTIYAPDGSSRTETANLLAYDVEVDAALLKMNLEDKVEYGARLASRAEIDAVHIFDNVFAVGCPLGNDPIPTYGGVADTHHVVDDARYWMISAPTYVGNSGGGIYEGETHELLGIFSKIYTHGTLRPTVVPHMGLMTPLTIIYDWLDRAGYPQIEAMANGTVETVAASD